MILFGLIRINTFAIRLWKNLLPFWEKVKLFIPV